jgi:hypothetical protein
MSYVQLKPYVNSLKHLFCSVIYITFILDAFVFNFFLSSKAYLQIIDMYSGKEELIKIQKFQ